MISYVKLFSLLFVLMATQSGAALIEGVEMPESVTVAGEKLVLNGVGVRTATFLKVRVYVAGLYLKTKSSDAKAILDSSGPKEVQMEFTHEFEGKNMALAWDKAFEDGCEGKECEEAKPGMQILKSYMEDLKKGDRMTYVFTDKVVEVYVGQKKKGTIPSKGFARTLLATWLGKNPPTEDLKAGLLGTAKH